MKLKQIIKLIKIKMIKIANINEQVKITVRKQEWN